MDIINIKIDAIKNDLGNPNCKAMGWTANGEKNWPRNLNVVNKPISFPRTASGVR